MYNSTRRSAIGALVGVCKCLKEALDREAGSHQQGVRDAVCVAAESTWSLFVDAPGATDKILGLIVGRTTCTGDSAGPGTASSRTASWDAHADASSSWAKSTNGPHTDLKPDSPDAHDLRGHSGCGAYCLFNCSV